MTTSSTLNSELTEQQIIAAWNSTEAGGMVGRYVRFARAIEAEVRKSAPNEPAQALPELPIKTWQERRNWDKVQLIDAGHSGKGLPLTRYMEAEIADLRAVIAASRTLPAKDDAHGLELTPVSWRVGPPSLDNVKIEACAQMDRSILWAARWRGNCLNKAGEWEWEPMPSGRDDDFLARCRFDTMRDVETTLAAALAASSKGEGK